MEQLLEKWNKYLLNEGGLSRVYDHIMEHDSAILTAFRNEYSNEDNFKRNRELKARLMTAGYGVTKMDGSYIENFETPRAIEVSERSLFASNRKDDPGLIDNITDLSEEYELEEASLFEDDDVIEEEGFYMRDNLDEEVELMKMMRTYFKKLSQTATKTKT